MIVLAPLLWLAVSRYHPQPNKTLGLRAPNKTKVATDLVEAVPENNSTPVAPRPTPSLSQRAPTPFPVIRYQPPKPDGCPLHCSGQGTCFDGTCSCMIGFKGPNCSQPVGCGRCDHGICYKAQCHCLPHYRGACCDTFVLNSPGNTFYHAKPVNLSNHTTNATLNHTSMLAGNASNGSCLNYTSAVEVRACSKQEDCNGNGICGAGICFCDEGWSGDNCDSVVRPPELRLDSKWGVPVLLPQEGTSFELTPEENAIRLQGKRNKDALQQLQVEAENAKEAALEKGKIARKKLADAETNKILQSMNAPTKEDGVEVITGPDDE